MRSPPRRPETVPAGSGDEPRRLRETALGLLARREHARAELAAKLRARGAAPETLPAVLDGLERDGLLSDARFAEVFVRSRRERGYGPVRILAELERRGVDAALGRQLLADEPGGWLQQARDARRRRFGDEPPADRREWLRQAGYLSRQGYTNEQVRAVLGED